jgi:hypothetical protein
MQSALVVKLPVEPDSAIGNLITDRDIAEWCASGRPLAGLLAPRPMVAADRERAPTKRLAMSITFARTVMRDCD